GNERTLLNQLGFSDSTPTIANAAVPGTPGTNTLFVTPQPYEAQVIASPDTTSRLGPSLNHPASVHLTTGASVHVTGTVGQWRAVDVQGTLRFVPLADLSPP